MRPKARNPRAAITLLILASAAGAADVFEKPARDYAVSGAVTTSDGKAATGLVYTTLGKPLEIYDEAKKKSVSFRLADVARIDIEVLREWDEPFWYWKESGSDEKVYTGKTYPVREYKTTVTFADGKKIAGALSGLVYVETDDAAKKPFTLYKRQKGKEGQKLTDLVYVKSVVVAEVASDGEAGATSE